MPDDHSDDVQMPFGKHKGSTLAEIDTEYLDWLIGQDWLRGDLRKLVEAQLSKRADWRKMGDEDE